MGPTLQTARCFRGVADMAKTQFLCHVDLQRCFSNPDITVSYDTSSPFLMGGKKSVYTFPKLNTKGFQLSSARIPVDRKNVGSSKRFPLPSSIGDKLFLGDLCVHDRMFQDSPWDGLSAMLVANHNLLLNQQTPLLHVWPK